MGKFKDLFIKDEAGDKKEQVAPQQNQGVEQQVNIPPRAFMGDYSPTSAAVESAKAEVAAPSQELVAKIWDTLLSKNFPGPDYLELKGHTSALEPFMPDYTQRLLAAFGVLKNQYPNFSVKIVTDSIDGYIKIVNEEKQEGEKECERVYGDKLKEKQENLDSISAQITQLQDEIREKSEQLSQLTQEKGTLQQEVLHAQEDMDRQAKVFSDSVNAVLNVLESDKRTISTLKV